jgi:hypothetical protein
MSYEWNNEKENLLRFWKEESNVYIWLSNKASEFYNLLNKVISIPCILISAISSTTILSNIYEDECLQNTRDDNTLADNIQNINSNQINTSLLVIGCFLALGTFLQSLKEFLNLDNKISKFDNNIKTNRILILDIEQQLYLERSERECPSKLIKRIKEIKKNLVTNTPVIPNFIKKRLKKAIERNEVLDIMSKSILYSYLKNQIIDVEGTMFNQNDTYNYDLDRNEQIDSNRFNVPNSNIIENKNILPEKSDIEITINSNLDSIINLEQSNISLYDSNQVIKNKILTNLYSL